MSQISSPLTPPDCDLRIYPTMPLDVGKLRDAGIVLEVSAEAFRAAILLWCASWHQVPCASLPDDDKHLARFAGYGVAVNAWREIRKEALYGFIKCSDGRLYHPTIADIALSSWGRSKKAKRIYIPAMVATRLKPRKNRAIPGWNDLRKAVFRRDNYICQYCGASDVAVECDHVIPFSRGGSSNMKNLITACVPCNRSKGDKTLEEWAISL